MISTLGSKYQFINQVKFLALQLININASLLAVLLITDLSEAHQDQIDIPVEDWSIQRTEQHHLLDENTDISIENDYGDIRTRTSNDNMLSIIVITQRHVNDTVEPRINVEPDDKNMKISVTYPESDPEVINPHVANRRVDISLLVPANGNLTIHTTHGRAESKGHRGALKVSTTSGPIVVVTNGEVDAKTQHGDIVATFKSRKWSTSSKLKTQTGSIRALLIEHPDVEVDIETAGNITTDYSLTIKSKSGSSFKIANSKIGDPAQSLTMISDRGEIILSRIFDMIHAEQKTVSNEGKAN